MRETWVFNFLNGSFSARAPELAKLYLVDKIKGCPDQWGSLLDLVLKYCQKFGGKSSTYFDLEPYLNLLDEEKASSLIESLLNGEPDQKCADSACCSHILPYLFKVLPHTIFSRFKLIFSVFSNSHVLRMLIN